MNPVRALIWILSIRICLGTLAHNEFEKLDLFTGMNLYLEP
jgi:hypothetical protein